MFNLNSGPFLLKEGKIQIGTFTNPQNIGTNVNDPLSFFSGQFLGYFKMGTLKIMVPRKYAEFRANTPSILVRKDLIQKDFNIECELGQFDADTMELAKGTLSQKNYAVTNPVGKTLDMHWFGSDEPNIPYYGYLITSKLTNGQPAYYALWYGKNTSEDVSFGLSGTAHATTKLKVEAFPSPDFNGVNVEEQKHYGMFWTEQ